MEATINMMLGDAKSEVLKLLDETKPKVDLTWKLDRFFDIPHLARKNVRGGR